VQGRGERSDILAQTEYDVVIYDDVGSPIDPKWVEEHPIGGSEYGMTQLAVGLAHKGYSVLAVSNLPDSWCYGAVDGPHCIDVKKVSSVKCKVLVSSRFSNPWRTSPQITAERNYIAAMDVYCDYYADHNKRMLAAQEGLASVFVSQWQADLFPPYWKKHVIPAMIDDEVYVLTSVEKDPKAFVYASSVIKGLPATLELWATLKGKLKGTAFGDIVLHVTGPGYDEPDLDLIRAAGAEWVGPKSTREMQKFIAAHVGLFFVNTFPECFCAVAAVAEAAGVRPHILCKHANGGMGALRQTINSSLLTCNEEQFIHDIVESLESSVQIISKPNDFRRSRVLRQWEHLLFGAVRTPEEVADHRGRLLAQERAPDKIGSSTPVPTAPPAQPLPASPGKVPTIGLIMIAKDEAHVLPRSLGSIKHMLDYYTIILDAENTDNSEEVIAQVMQGVPGEVHREPYINVSYCRNRAIFHASKRTDYLFALDADDVFEGSFDKAQLFADTYDIRLCDGSAPSAGGNIPVNEGDHGCCIYMRPVMVKSNRGFKYVGVDHEYLMSEEPNLTRGLITSAIMRRYVDGRSWITPEITALKAEYAAGKIPPLLFEQQLAALADDACRKKFFKRGQLLEEELKKNPTDSRSAYYAAQNYKDARSKHNAVRMYLQRASMGGWDQEVFLSLLTAADILESDDPACTGAISWEKLMLQACEVCPMRAPEALYHLSFCYYKQKRYMPAYIYAKATIGIEAPPSNMPCLFADEGVYSWKVAMVYAWSALQLGHKREAKTIIEVIMPKLPPTEAEVGKRIIMECDK
jgi:glycosyltransferase involved in cell wall biosynthesis